MRTLIAARHVVGDQDGGHRLLDHGEVVVEGIDERRLARDLQGAAARMWAKVGATDWARRSVDEISPHHFRPDGTEQGSRSGPSTPRVSMLYCALRAGEVVAHIRQGGPP